MFVAALIGGVAYWLDTRNYEWTDDAFIAARSFSVAPKVGGYVTQVPVTDNQHVSAGNLLASIDSRDYKTALDQAKAQVAVAQADIDNVQAQIESQRQQIDQAKAQLESARASLQQAKAQLDQAKLNLQYTELRAAQPGRVVNLTGAVVTFAAAGQSLMMFVPDDVWIIANYKETQLSHMRPGDPVELTIDAYPAETLTGRVVSVQPGSGTAFSLLLAENATGNDVKVVQRVPVKIVVDKWPADMAIGPGMSVVPWTKVR